MLPKFETPARLRQLMRNSGQRWLKGRDLKKAGKRSDLILKYERLSQ